MGQHSAPGILESRIDPWLRFTVPVEADYEAEHGVGRVADLRVAIFVGLCIYNIYNLTSLILLPDIFWLSVALRLLVVTPGSLAIAWAVGLARPVWRERLILFGTLNAYAIPLYLFWRTQEPSGLFTFAELTLSIVFANMLITLRFRHAVAYTALVLALTTLAVLSKAGLDPPLRIAFLTQIATACAFGLYANRRVEKRRCLDHIATIDARAQATRADAARRQFEDLSRTDALTELPNRRHLAARLDEWLAQPAPVALLMIDIDYFKLYNDTFGHPAGDACLRQVAAILAACGRSENRFCARFGGEEFAVVLRDAREVDAVRLAKSIAARIEAAAIPHPARPDAERIVTISTGIALAVGTAKDPLIGEADRALYLAKRRGRNCFALAEAPATASAIDARPALRRST